MVRDGGGASRGGGGPGRPGGASRGGQRRLLRQPVKEVRRRAEEVG
jgi:hypothetical protein